LPVRGLRLPELDCEWSSHRQDRQARGCADRLHPSEGSTTAWFKGRLYDAVDGSEFFNVLCEEKITCNGTIIERPQKVWWIRLRTMKGLTGWTNEPEKFDNKDRFG
jgi:hypothetical protein